MKEDYSEKVIELLCEKIDELEKENKRLKSSILPTNSTISWSTLSSTPTSTFIPTCIGCGCYPCQCNKGTAMR